MNELRVEFHCHTEYSRDCLTPVDRLVTQARLRGVDRLVVTDHNTLRGALLAKELDPELVIVGEEILTTQGEFLAAFVTQEIPRGLEPLEALRRLREQGAFVSLSHPFDLRRHGWPLPELEKISPLVDAIEIFNARCQLAGLNRSAEEYARARQIPGGAGSDAHTLREVGRATVLLPAFAGADELRRVIGQGRIEGVLSSPFIHLTSTYARMVKEMRGRK